MQMTCPVGHDPPNCFEVCIEKLDFILLLSFPQNIRCLRQRTQASQLMPEDDFALAPFEPSDVDLSRTEIDSHGRLVRFGIDRLRPVVAKPDVSSRRIVLLVVGRDNDRTTVFINSFSAGPSENRVFVVSHGYSSCEGIPSKSRLPCLAICLRGLY